MAPLPTPEFILHLKRVLMSSGVMPAISDSAFAILFATLAVAAVWACAAWFRAAMAATMVAPSETPAAKISVRTPGAEKKKEKADDAVSTSTKPVDDQDYMQQQQQQYTAAPRSPMFRSRRQQRAGVTFSNDASGGHSYNKARDERKAAVQTALDTLKEAAASTDDGSTFIAMVIDRSGSMASMGPEVAGSINAYLDTSRKDDADKGTSTTLLLSIFDAQYETLHTSTPLPQVNPVVDSDVKPRGSTALHDAIGFCIRDTAKAVGEMPVRPGKVIVFILTDGHENASSTFTSEEVKALIADARDTHKWEFFFAAANQDAVMTGSQSLGLASSDCITYGGSRAKMRTTFLSAGAATLRSKSGRSKAWTPSERSACG